MTVRAVGLAVFAGLIARPVHRARDLWVARASSSVQRAYRLLWQLEGLHPSVEPSFEAVRQARQSGLPLDTLTWGETPLSTAVELLRLAGVGPSSSVLDLGAGRGHVLLAARLLGARARGVELDPRRVAGAAPILAEIGAELVVGDAREADLGGATHIWLSWTCMPPLLREQLAGRLEGAAAGTRLIALTWVPPAPFVARATLRRFFPWGRTDVVVADR